MTIWAIPGFLGLSSDWDFLGWPTLIGVDLYAFPWVSLSDWAARFNQSLHPGSEPAIVMGYSLGGRLALHALLDKPAAWRAAIIISAHTGLSDVKARSERWHSDQEWAERFKHEEWQALMQAWNSQSIFADDSVLFRRLEGAYQRSALSRILIAGSLGRQQDLRAAVAVLPMPILWITGSYDLRCGQIAERLTFAHPHSRWVVLAPSGHRVPWNQPQVFARLVAKFLRELPPLLSDAS